MPIYYIARMAGVTCEWVHGNLVMNHAYRLVYPLSQHAPPQLWEYEQPYIDNLLLNARTFARFVVQWYFEDWAAIPGER